MNSLLPRTRSVASYARLSTLILAASVLFLPKANAAAVYSGIGVDMFLKQNTFPPGQVEEKVFLDKASLEEITGHVGAQNDPRLVSIASATDLLNAANGFATIKAADGLINSITITAPGYWFEDLVFTLNLSAGPGQRPHSNHDLVVTTTDSAGNVDTFADWTALPDWGRGNNRIQLISTTGNLIESVTIASQAGMPMAGGLKQFKQIEISGLTAIPLPAAIWLFGSGLVGLIAIARLKRA